MDELCTPKDVQTTPPPRRNKAGRKHSRKRSAQGKRKDAKGTEPTSTVDTKYQVAEPNLKEETSVSSARLFLDESILKPDRQSSVSASSTEPLSRASQGSFESEKPLSQTRLSPQSNVDVGTEIKTQNSSTGRVTSIASSASQDSHPISGFNVNVITSPTFHEQPVVMRSNEAGIVSNKEDSDKPHDKAKSDSNIRISQVVVVFNIGNDSICGNLCVFCSTRQNLTSLATGRWLSHSS